MFIFNTHLDVTCYLPFVLTCPECWALFPGCMHDFYNLLKQKKDETLSINFKNEAYIYNLHKLLYWLRTVRAVWTKPHSQWSQQSWSLFVFKPTYWWFFGFILNNISANQLKYGSWPFADLSCAQTTLCCLFLSTTDVYQSVLHGCRPSSIDIHTTSLHLSYWTSQPKPDDLEMIK